MHLPLSVAIALCMLTARGEDWPQFRGPGGRAVSETATPPIGFGPSSNLLWKVPIPEGVSSPIVAGERIFLTAQTGRKIETLPLAGELNFLDAESDKSVQTLAFDRKTGRILWQRDYWSSPVAAAGRAYFASEKGVVTVIDANADTPAILAQNKLDEQILATPALIGQTIVIRTAKHLYSFGASK